MKRLLVAILIYAFVTPSYAEYWCKALALRDTHYNESTDTLIRKGQVEAFTTDNGPDLCQHGGYCVKRRDFRLLDCDVHLNPIRTKANTEDVRYSDIENTLVEMGLCNACAGNAASWYIYRPSSPTGQLVKAALEGNPLAKQKLQQDWDSIPNYPY
jgi:hypothetical protein